MSLPDKISIIEVAPRDGWQNFRTFIPTGEKIRLIKKMIDNGARSVEVTSYVNPKWVPQLADADEVTGEALAYAEGRGVTVSALTLNGKGVARARGLGMKNVGFVISASEEHNRRNANKTTEAVLADFEAMASESRDMDITLGVACAFGSPFGEEIGAEDIFRICETAAKYGISKVGLADSAGVSTPAHTRDILRAVLPQLGADNVSVHFHDTRGMGLANAYVAMEEGVRRFETALGAMGGCPYIPGAKGNIATEDVLWMAAQMGIETEPAFEQTVELSLEMTAAIGAPITSSQASLASARRSGG